MHIISKQVTEGCTTDTEKVTAIYNWITTSIRYVDGTSPFSSDVLYMDFERELWERHSDLQGDF